VNATDDHKGNGDQQHLYCQAAATDEKEKQERTGQDRGEKDAQKGASLPAPFVIGHESIRWWRSGNAVILLQP
jgi:hypothetical protein